VSAYEIKKTSKGRPNGIPNDPGPPDWVRMEAPGLQRETDVVTAAFLAGEMDIGEQVEVREQGQSRGRKFTVVNEWDQPAAGGPRILIRHD
jgi:hypothetical protein